MAARRCSPPDNVPSSRSAKDSRPTSASARVTRCASAAPAASQKPRCANRPSNTLSRNEPCGAASGSCGRNPRRMAISRRAIVVMSRPSMRTVPAAGARRPASVRNNSDFPVPLPPSSAMNSPARIVQSNESMSTRPGTATRSCAASSRRRSLADPADFEGGGVADDDIVERIRHLERACIDGIAPGHDFGERLRVKWLPVRLRVTDGIQRRQRDADRICPMRRACAGFRAR